MTRFCVTVMLLLLLAPALNADPPAAVFRNGKWQPVEPPPPVLPVTDAELDHMSQLLAVGDARAALNVGISWIKTRKKEAPLRDRALYQVALAKYKIDGQDDWINAYYYCDELMDEYPNSRLFNKALELQFSIADQYLGGHLNGLLGFRLKIGALRLVPMEDEAIEMLYRIQERSPGSPLAEKSLLRSCDYYYSTGGYELAHDAYGFYVKTYPRSPHLPEVKLRQAFSSLAQFHGVRFDPTCLLDARAELADIVAAYPELAREQNLETIITRIDAALARKSLVTADYYRRTGATRGAVYVYRNLIETYPDSPDSAEAKKALATMPKKARADLPPVAGAAVPLGPAKEGP